MKRNPWPLPWKLKLSFSPTTIISTRDLLTATSTSRLNTMEHDPLWFHAASRPWDRVRCPSVAGTGTPSNPHWHPPPLHSPRKSPGFVLVCQDCQTIYPSTRYDGAHSSASLCPRRMIAITDLFSFSSWYFLLTKKKMAFPPLHSTLTFNMSSENLQENNAATNRGCFPRLPRPIRNGLTFCPWRTACAVRTCPPPTEAQGRNSASLLDPHTQLEELHYGRTCRLLASQETWLQSSVCCSDGKCLQLALFSLPHQLRIPPYHRCWSSGGPVPRLLLLLIGFSDRRWAHRCTDPWAQPSTLAWIHGRDREFHRTGRILWGREGEYTSNWNWKSFERL